MKALTMNECTYSLFSVLWVSLMVIQLGFIHYLLKELKESNRQKDIAISKCKELITWIKQQ